MISQSILQVKMLDKKTWFGIYVIAFVVSLFSLPRSFFTYVSGPLDTIIFLLLQFSIFYLPPIVVYVGINLLKSFKPNLGNYISNHRFIVIGLYFLAEGISFVIYRIITPPFFDAPNYFGRTWIDYLFIFLIILGILLISIGIIKLSALKKASIGIGTGIIILMILVFVGYQNIPTGPPMESGTPIIESLKILGYDARDLNELKAHDGITMLKNSAGIQNNAKEKGERVVIYLRNEGVQTITISELRFGATVYNFQGNVGAIDNYEGTVPQQGNYVILTDGASGLLQSSSELQPGQIASVVLDLTDQFKIGRDTQFKMTTSNGSVFVATIENGGQRG